MLIKPVFLSSQLLIFQRYVIILGGGEAESYKWDKLMQLNYIKGLNQQFRSGLLNIRYSFPLDE